ncbi:MAG: hypothetical protein J6J97_05860 [Akkermansia sp.]|nr:hypothetical protein [Akkermansia sp.]
MIQYTALSGFPTGVITPQNTAGVKPHPHAKNICLWWLWWRYRWPSSLAIASTCQGIKWACTHAIPKGSRARESALKKNRVNVSPGICQHAREHVFYSFYPYFTHIFLIIIPNFDLLAHFVISFQNRFFRPVYNALVHTLPFLLGLVHKLRAGAAAVVKPVTWCSGY